MVAFSPPTRADVAWGHDLLFRHYGSLRAGITIYKDGTGWHEAPDGYEESLLADATVIYYGGREYDITMDQYNELVAAGFAT